MKYNVDHRDRNGHADIVKSNSSDYLATAWGGGKRPIKMTKKGRGTIKGGGKIREGCENANHT